MNFDNVAEFVAQRERVRTPGDTQQQTAKKMGCPWRSYQRWMQRWRESALWASQQVLLTQQPEPAPLQRKEDLA